MKKGKQVCKKEFLAGLVVEEQYKENKAIKFNYFFTNRRINSKYLQLANKYKDIKLLDYNYIYSELVEIIVEVLDSMKKDYIFIADSNRNDDISYIITTMEQRINDKIDKNWTFSYRDRSKENLERDEDEKDRGDTELEYSLDDIVYTNNGEETTRGAITPNEDNVFYNHNTKTDEEIDIALDKIYKDAKLTKRQIEILEALERTGDNFNNREIYTKVHASEILGTSEENIRKTFYTIKNKIINAYGEQVPILTDTRQDLIKKLDRFLENIESEKDVIEFIKENLEEEFVLYILYDSKLDLALTRYFNRNKDIEESYNSDEMRKFTTYFIRGVYTYIELLEDNLLYEKITVLRPKEVKENRVVEDNKGNKVVKYIREDKATQQQKSNEFIMINDEKYYLVKDDETIEISV